MTDKPDPDQTRDIHLPPPAAPTRQFRTPPPVGPTRQIRTPPQRRPTPPHTPPPTSNEGELPWWQTINRDRSTPTPVPPVERRPHPVPQPQQPPVARPVSPRSAPPDPQTTSAEPQRRSQRNMLIGAGLSVAVAAAIAIGAMLGSQPGSSATVLDVSKAQQGVAQVLVDPVNGYGVTSLGSVACNNGANPVVQQGNSFTCAVVIEGAQRNVTVVFQDDDGTYAVDRPR